jgi:hypothetical protein
MPMMTLTPKDRRTLMWGGVLVLILGVFGRGIPAWYRWRSEVHRETVDIVKEATLSWSTIQRARTLAHFGDTDEETYFSLRPVFVSGETIAASSTALTSVVSDAAQANNLKIDALQIETDTTEQRNLLHPTVRGSATGDIRGVAHFLATLEGGVPLLSVRHLAITQSEPQSPNNSPEVLHVEFLVEALGHPNDREEHMQATTDQFIDTSFVSLPTVRMFDWQKLADQSDSIVANDIFRPEHLPAQIVFGTPPIQPPVSTPPAGPTIHPILRGLIGGPPWHAILSGIPGHQGDVAVSVGDTMNALTIRAIRRDTVVVRSPDTTWTLTRRP